MFEQRVKIDNKWYWATGDTQEQAASKLRFVLVQAANKFHEKEQAIQDVIETLPTPRPIYV